VKKYYCEKCDCRVESNVTKQEIDLPVKGESIVVSADIRICNTCGGECYDEELEQKLFETAYDIYRTRHNIISPAEIVEIREKYSLSQRNLAVILGWGAITIHRYENGSLPDDAHNMGLQLLTDPENFQRIFNKNKDRLPERIRLRVEARLNEMIKGNRKDLVRVVSPQENYQPSVYTGHLKFSEEMLENMILYFASQADGVLKTKLNKLLWYADFLHYDIYSVSITGTAYVPLPQGPVPDDYDYYY